MEQKIKDDLKQAMLAKDEMKVSTLRMLQSEVTYLRVSKGLKNTEETLSDTDFISVVQKEAKKRKEAAEGFRKGGREDQALKEESELAILQAYLPEQISDEELTKIVEDSINSVGAKSLADMGTVIRTVMEQVGQKAEGSKVSALVKEKLS